MCDGVGFEGEEQAGVSYAIALTQKYNLAFSLVQGKQLFCSQNQCQVYREATYPILGSNLFLDFEVGQNQVILY